MKILLFYHSLVSDWNHGNAHFLRGITTELLKRGHNVQVFEPHNGWSYAHWKEEIGIEGIKGFKEAYPSLQTNFYSSPKDYYQELKDADLVIAHEWNEPDMIKELGDLKKEYQYKLLFHDTHHRSVTSPDEITRYDLSEYDGVLAFGEKIRSQYLKNNWADRAWTWHEAADTNLFKPVKNITTQGDLVWVGNWGDDERTEEIIEFLIEPVYKLGLKAKMYGVRYPDDAKRLLKNAGIEYEGYLPSYDVPEVYSKYRFTIHIPRRSYAVELPGIPTIRPFEAMACGIPLISAPWQDTENLFRTGVDFLMVQDGKEMMEAMDMLLNDKDKADSQIRNGLETIRNYHTCAHRVDELMEIYKTLSESDQKKSNVKIKAGHEL